jgi:hypothetical protein
MKLVVRTTPFSAFLTGALLVLAGSVGAAGLPTTAAFSVAAYAPSISAKAKKAKSGKKSKSSRVSFHDGSAESRSERDRRLMRECKGRSNSGVCEGYTR